MNGLHLDILESSGLIEAASVLIIITMSFHLHSRMSE